MQNCVIYKHECMHFKSRHHQLLPMQPIRRHRWLLHMLTAIKHRHYHRARSPNKSHRRFSPAAHQIPYWTMDVAETIYSRTMCHKHNRWPTQCIHHRLCTVRFRHRMAIPCLEIYWPNMRWKLKRCHIHRRMAFIRTIIMLSSISSISIIITISIISSKWYLNIKTIAVARLWTMNMNCNHKSWAETWNVHQLSISKRNEIDSCSSFLYIIILYIFKFIFLRKEEKIC